MRHKATQATATGVAEDAAAKRIHFYNLLVEEHELISKDDHGSKKFRAMFKARFPKQYEFFLRRHREQYLTINTVFKFLFPTPRCAWCGASTIFKVYCSGEHCLLYTTGFANPLQNPETKARWRATNLERTGYEHPHQSEKTRDRFKRTMKRRHGATNPLQSEKILAKHKNTMRARYGSESFWASAKFRSMHKEVGAKKEATCLKNYGVRHHMQDPEIFERVMRSARLIKSYDFGGRQVEVQSTYEWFAFKILTKRYGSDNVVTQFDPEFPDYAFAELGTFPDLYVASIDLFVEVKSTWTLLGRKWLAQNRKKARDCNASGNKVRWVVVLNPAKGAYKLLPLDWHIMTRSEITRFLGV